MNEKKIVSIEDRIPKLKQKRKKKANRRLIFYLSIFFLLICIIVYLQSPLSNIKIIKVTGNIYLSDDEVIQESNLSKDTNIWTIKEKKIEQKLSEHILIKNVKVNKKLPRSIEIIITEHKRVAYLKEENKFYPVLGNGTILPAVKQSVGDAPMLIGFHEDEYLMNMTNELNNLSESILNLISEVHWKPIEEDQNRIYLYMNDGYIVDGTIKNFSEKMTIYPSIVSQLDPESEGIIHIGVGAYFEEFNNVLQDSKIENETE